MTTGTAGAAWYRMLETLRDFGQEKLIEAGERAELRRRHRDWYTHLARRFAADLISSRQPEWFARVERELPNLRAALEYSLADPDGAEAALAIPASSNLYWAVCGRHREGRFWADRALARPAGSTMTRLKALYLSAALAVLQGDFPAARVRVRQAYEVAAQRGDSLAYAFADAIRGVTEMGGDLAEAAAGYEAVLAICRPRGEAWFVGLSLWSLGVGLWKRGDLHAAAARLREGVQCLRSVNDAFGTAYCLDALALGA